MIPGAQPDSYVNTEALTKSLVVQQMVVEVLICITHFLHIVVLIRTRKINASEASHHISRHADKRHFQWKNIDS